MIFTIGNYLPGNSALHRFDPRLKLLSIISITIVVLAVTSFKAYGILILLLVWGMIAIRTSIRLLIMQMKIWGWLFLLTVLLHLLFTKGTVFLNVMGIGLTYEGLERGFIFGLRFVIFIFSAFLLTATTTPFELARAISSLISPLRWIKIPVDDLAMVISIAFRFIPVIFDEAIAIKLAQEARGLDFSRYNVFKPKRLVSLLIPLFYSVFRKADDLTEALISRHYRPGVKRTSIYARSISVLEIATFIFIISICLSIVILL